MLNLEKRLVWLKKVIGEKNVVLGVSGGLDSSVCAALLARVLPPERINLLFLPYSDQDFTIIEKLMTNLNLTSSLTTINLKNLLEPFKKTLKITRAQDKVRLGNLVARTRMSIVYDFAKANDALVCTTVNKSEFYLGYFTLWGDSVGDVAPLLDLTKTQVRHLAVQLKIPAQIIDQAPSAGLWPGQTDENELGFDYELADQVIEKLESNKNSLTWNDDEQKVLTRIEALVYKRHVPYHFDQK